MGILSPKARRVIVGVVISYTFLLGIWTGRATSWLVNTVRTLWYAVRRAVIVSFWIAAALAALPHWVLYAGRILEKSPLPTAHLLATVAVMSLLFLSLMAPLYLGVLALRVLRLPVLAPVVQATAERPRVDPTTGKVVAGGGGSIHEYSEEEAAIREAVEKAKEAGVFNIDPEDLEAYLRRREAMGAEV